MMQKISAIIITFNEERQIARCLQSLDGIADEIIVADSFSTDRTREICRSYNVRFFEHVFSSYSEQKNRAMAQAAHPAVLNLDADEVLSEELRKSILEIKNSWPADGYFFTRTTFLGSQPVRHGNWYPDYKLRLFDKRKGRFGGINPHENVIMDARAKTKRIKSTILHYSFETLDDFYCQSRRFAALSAQAMFERGITVSPLMRLLKTGWIFLRGYIVKAGFLDGRAGFTISRVIAASTYRKYRQLRRLQQKAIFDARCSMFDA
ncbi:MAG: glycosyltransferase family 2 protein [Prevotellaceae bacterium]|jgi:glycosyltransferase involved in cell wall biosynthesis|nr:glycosyltransferase family 2 protein [Prevotellaceae bacterium]